MSNYSNIKKKDQYFTLSEVASKCISLVENIEGYDLIIEPSAGEGSFSNQLECVAYDIEPSADGIIQKDWFEVEKQEGRVLVIGNPPFGSRSSLAKDFIKHSINIGADTIAFILPETFNKLTQQSKTVFPANWRLIHVEELDRKSYTLNGKIYGVPCSFFIWTKDKGALNLRKAKIKNHPDFTFLPRGTESADFCINGNNGKIREVGSITNDKAEHFIQSNIGKDKLIEKFSQVEYIFYSSVNGGNAWIGQQDILESYSKIYK